MYCCVSHGCHDILPCTLSLFPRPALTDWYLYSTRTVLYVRQELNFYVQYMCIYMYIYINVTVLLIIITNQKACLTYQRHTVLYFPYQIS
jgi:hypothetical protein